MKYSVLVKRVVNVRIDDIDTASQVSAIQEANKLKFGEIIGKMQRQRNWANSDRTPIVIRYVEDGDETAYYLADEDGDEEFSKSNWYGKDGKTVLDPADRCPECFRERAAPELSYDEEVTALMSADLWNSHPDHSRVDWRIEAGLGHTQLGYWPWVQHQIESRRMS
jgi:hypothetical protein